MCPCRSKLALASRFDRGIRRTPRTKLCLPALYFASCPHLGILPSSRYPSIISLFTCPHQCARPLGYTLGTRDIRHEDDIGRAHTFFTAHCTTLISTTSRLCSHRQSTQASGRRPEQASTLLNCCGTTFASAKAHRPITAPPCDPRAHHP